MNESFVDSEAEAAAPRHVGLQLSLQNKFLGRSAAIRSYSRLQKIMELGSYFLSLFLS